MLILYSSWKDFALLILSSHGDVLEKRIGCTAYSIGKCD